MKRFLKNLIFGFLYPLSYLNQQRFAVALMYHSISDSSWQFALSPEDFEQQIIYLKNNFQIISLSELKRFLDGEFRADKNMIVLTFDDVYSDFKTKALPILEKYQVPAAIFVHTGRSSDELGNSLELLPWEDIKNLPKIITVGNHSHSHPNLKYLDENSLIEELSLSEKSLDEHIGEKPQWFAYPGGKFNSIVEDSLKSRGYDGAFSINRGIIVPEEDRFALKRFGPTKTTSWLEFKARLTKASEWYEKLIKLF